MACGGCSAFGHVNVYMPARFFQGISLLACHETHQNALRAAATGCCHASYLGTGAAKEAS